MKIEHVGWVTQNKKLFETFWCDHLGFSKIFETDINPEMAMILFEISFVGTIARYQREEVIIEIH